MQSPVPLNTEATKVELYPGRRAIAGMLIFAAVLTTAYWLTWFTNRSILASANTIQYYTFENAFPAADAWLAISALIAAVGLLRGQSWGIFWTIVASGSGIYLGCMDVLFDLENGIYSFKGDPSSAIIELIINVLTFGLGTIGLLWAWNRFKKMNSAVAH